MKISHINQRKYLLNVAGLGVVGFALVSFKKIILMRFSIEKTCYVTTYSQYSL